MTAVLLNVINFKDNAVLFCKTFTSLTFVTDVLLRWLGCARVERGVLLGWQWCVTGVREVC